MPDRIADLRVGHQLGLGCGAGGEVDQQRIVNGGPRSERPGSDDVGGLRVAMPAGGVGAHHDAVVVAVDVVELGGVGGVGDHDARPTAGDAVGALRSAQGTGRRHDHRPELGDGQGGLPELDLIAQHQDDAIALADAELLQPRRHPVGALGHRGEADALFAAVFLDDPQRGAVVAAGNDVEPIGGPVEVAGELWPGKSVGGPVSDGEDLVTRGAVALGVGGHGS